MYTTFSATLQNEKNKIKGGGGGVLLVFSIDSRDEVPRPCCPLATHLAWINRVLGCGAGEAQPRPALRAILRVRFLSTDPSQMTARAALAEVFKEVSFCSALTEVIRLEGATWSISPIRSQMESSAAV